MRPIFSIKAVEENIVPPTINHADDDVDPAIDPRAQLHLQQGAAASVRAALSNVFGFGGHNATIIVKKYEE